MKFWKTASIYLIGSSLSLTCFAADFGAIKGLWDFTSPSEPPIQVTIPGTPPTTVLVPVPNLGPQGASTLTSDEDLAPNRQGHELLAVGTRNQCINTSESTFNWQSRETRKFYSTRGDELATFEMPTISLSGLTGQCVNLSTPPLTNRSSSSFAADKGTRVYVYSRAFYPPPSPLQSPALGVWHISVFRVDGSWLWTKEFRPASEPEDGIVWNISVPRSAVGPLLDNGARTDVIRVARTGFDPVQLKLIFRYTFYDLLTGLQIADERFSVTPPAF